MKQDNISDCMPIEKDKVERVKASELFKVLGDNTRIRILTSLAQEELCVCDLSVALNMTKSAVSHQLKKLKDERRVKSRKVGKNVYYSLDDEHVVDIVNKALDHIRHN